MDPGLSATCDSAWLTVLLHTVLSPLATAAVGLMVAYTAKLTRETRSIVKNGGETVPASPEAGA